MSINFIILVKTKKKTMLRLTVHLMNANTESVKTGKKRVITDPKGKSKNVDETKRKTFTTLSFRGLRDQKDIESALSKVRERHDIAIALDNNRKSWKAGEEMYHISREK